MTDEKLQTMIGNLLRAGVLFSAAIVSAAGVVYLIQHHSDVIAYRAFHMESADLRVLPGILRSAARLHTDAIIQLGLVFLIATPIARVALAAVGFYLERDRLYVAVSLIVLAILLYSVMHAVRL
jgi:uncharacterized membrane protein